MLPKKLHIEQVDRLHDKIKELSEFMDKYDISNIKELESDVKDKLRENGLKYFELTSKIWTKFDNAIEELKNELDCL